MLYLLGIRAEVFFILVRCVRYCTEFGYVRDTVFAVPRPLRPRYSIRYSVRRTQGCIRRRGLRRTSQNERTIDILFYYSSHENRFFVQFLRRVVALQLFMTMTATCSRFCTKTFVNFYVEQRPLFQVQFLRMCDGSSALIKVGQALYSQQGLLVCTGTYHIIVVLCSLFSCYYVWRMEVQYTIRTSDSEKLTSS